MSSHPNDSPKALVPLGSKALKERFPKVYEAAEKFDAVLEKPHRDKVLQRAEKILAKKRHDHRWWDPVLKALVWAIPSGVFYIVAYVGAFLSPSHFAPIAPWYNISASIWAMVCCLGLFLDYAKWWWSISTAKRAVTSAQQLGLTRGEQDILADPVKKYCYQVVSATFSLRRLMDEFNLYVRGSRSELLGIKVRPDEDQLHAWLLTLQKEIDEHLEAAAIRVDLQRFEQHVAKNPLPEITFVLEDTRESAARLHAMSEVHEPEQLGNIDADRKLELLEKEIAHGPERIQAVVQAARRRAPQKT